MIRRVHAYQMRGSIDDVHTYAAPGCCLLFYSNSFVKQEEYTWIRHNMETVVLLSKLKVDHHIEIELKMDELDLTAAESKATYDEIKAYAGR